VLNLRAVYCLGHAGLVSLNVTISKENCAKNRINVKVGQEMEDSLAA
jgi:hypothetical protein